MFKIVTSLKSTMNACERSSLRVLSVLLFLLFQIMCRCSTPLENSVKEKISMFCHVEPEQVSLDHAELKTTHNVITVY